MKTQSLLRRLLDYIFSLTPPEPVEIVTIPNTLYPGCWRPRMISTADDICSYTTLLTELHKKGVLRKYSDILHEAKKHKDRIKKVDRILSYVGLHLRSATSPVLPLPAPPLPLTPLFIERNTR